MKTVFLTIFEGVEAKNLLRTSVVPTLLADPTVRIVLLAKSEERVARYRAEFADPRLLYEVVERPASRGLDRFFAYAKFMLLRTATTNIRRRMAYELRRNLAAYWGVLLVNFLLARPLVRRLARWLDYHLVQDETYAALFDRYTPDLVFTAHLFDEPEIQLIREARRRGVKTVTFVNSWDKVTARCTMRLLPDKAIVFNDIVKAEMVRYNDMRPEDIAVSGIPQYDVYAGHAAGFASRDAFCAAAGIPADHRIIVYAPMGRAFSESDWDMIDRMHELIVAGTLGERVAMLVRFQPNDFIDEKELHARPWLHYDLPGVRFALKRGVDWDMDEADVRHLVDTLAHASLVLCYASSIAIDAAFFDKPVMNINFELEPSQARTPFQKPTRFFETAHYRNALQTGGIRLVGSEGELVVWIKRYLADPSIDREGRARLVREQCQFTDGKSGERVGTFVLGQVRT